MSEDRGSIIRGKHDREHPYVMISKEMFRDKNLSPKTKGVLGYLLCLPDNWKTNPRQVADALGVGKDQIYSALNEMIKHGYAKRKNLKNDKGHFEKTQYEFFEEKIAVSENPDTDKRDPENQDYNEDRELQEIKEGRNEKDPFIDFLHVEDEEEKLQILKKYPLDSTAINKILEFSLDYIKTSLKAYDQWVAKRIEQGRPPTDVVAPVMKAILNGWKPTLTTEEIQQEQDEQVQKYENKIKEIRDHVKQIEKSCEGKIPFKYSIKANENEVVLRSDMAYTPISYAEEDVIKIVQNHLNKYWIKE